MEFCHSVDETMEYGVCYCDELMFQNAHSERCTGLRGWSFECLFSPKRCSTPSTMGYIQVVFSMIPQAIGLGNLYFAYSVWTQGRKDSRKKHADPVLLTSYLAMAWITAFLFANLWPVITLATGGNYFWYIVVFPPCLSAYAVIGTLLEINLSIVFIDSANNITSMQVGNGAGGKQATRTRRVLFAVGIALSTLFITLSGFGNYSASVKMHKT